MSDHLLWLSSGIRPRGRSGPGNLTLGVDLRLRLIREILILVTADVWRSLSGSVNVGVLQLLRVVVAREIGGYFEKLGHQAKAVEDEVLQGSNGVAGPESVVMAVHSVRRMINMFR
ncbi:hypothetical protein Scep_006516 [Stephania cephalantha]|uniref:Uncharacterized protein n=1 Tax=Stephania cephalantha TaxID=152367 RepID=A0AAP0PMA8_9MAGN